MILLPIIHDTTLQYNYYTFKKKFKHLSHVTKI